ncbi:hypothetical protein B2G71_22230 [Novosphingobium sp. PC22D]|uniref:acyl carrier protein n=1 Tax=Novosphingobium sp. PC22D TaxID=1962403 RepID=UPI000BFAF1E8|nr:acyl carrier protein [Novosphingobium sp. PC22D]PEQ10478.1 hypothetical protein B2G71_22230 [Novosphingobium sp. PC22D]
MDREEIVAKLVECMEGVFDLDDVEYDDSLSAADIEEWDSLSNIRFMVAIEKEFGLRFSNGEIEALGKVGELVNLIQSKLA